MLHATDQESSGLISHFYGEDCSGISSRNWLEKIEAETVGAYELLAYEYDAPDHATTRALERLSKTACQRAFALQAVGGKRSKVIEIGCGTGAISEILCRAQADGDLVLVDASESMLRLTACRIRACCDGERTIRYVNDSILSPRKHWGTDFDLMVAALADPYLIKPAIGNMRQFCRRGAALVLTLPERLWAVGERRGRLTVPLFRTRFRLASGVEVRPYSFTYSPMKVCALLDGGGFEVQKIWVEQDRRGTPSNLREPAVLSVVARAD